MELPLESIDPPLDTFRPRTGAMDAWNAAYVRVEDYLRAHRIHNRLHQNRVIRAVLERAARRHEANPALDPTTLAAEETEAWMDEWFGAVLGEAGLPHERIATTGRVALLVSDGAEKWPYAFLDTRTIPPDFRDAMRHGHVEAGPDMTVSSMVPRPIDLGVITEAAGDTLETLERRPMLRMFALWLVFIGSLAAIFFMTR
ncbi:hypothetical protein OH491_22565 [Termitidicoccus mucosus]|uniref:hypothetical protein n=1 Tax=Termitidicoccus mucosus TaxID=1184151 RepID=UPI0011AB3817